MQVREGLEECIHASLLGGIRAIDTASVRPSLKFAVVLWEGCRESRRCSRDTYPESYTTKYTSIRINTALGRHPRYRHRLGVWIRVER